MQQSKGCKRHYFSVESILASEEQISCSFLRDQYDIGFLEAGNTTNKISAGTNLQLPYWIASCFSPYPRVVNVGLPKPYKKAFRDVLKADPTVVDLKSLSRHYYLLGEHLVKLNQRESPEIRSILIQVELYFIMTVTELSLNFSQPLYYAGEMVRGTVTIKLDAPKVVKGVELRIKGKAEFSWSESQSYTDFRGERLHKSVIHRGKDTYLKTNIKLVEGKTTLTAGEHTYPFAVMLPVSAPSAFTGTYGGITYYGIARINVPFVCDDIVKKFFLVNDPLNVNDFPHLKSTIKKERSKTFCCCCCANGPLSLSVALPKSGYSKTETIPITVEVDNISRVAVDKVTAYLCQRIVWRADSGHIKDEKAKLKKVTFGEVPQHCSRTWSKSLSLLDVEFPRNISKCSKITITRTLTVTAEPRGTHTDLLVNIPLTIGDIPFYDEDRFAPPYVIQLATDPDPPPHFRPVTYVPRMRCIIS
ncbi:hypothetical protein V9T40_010158 [Parthenolecanium corni]|uniref:Arrestin C-terminal-like domain-containing protein n=1 Tax=Parthenolecanium corni TaxID=536013 RepID=A0AAN9XXT1_9HEMI